MGGTAADGDSGWKIELNDQERGALGKALLERKARLIEHTGDTTQPRAMKRAGLLELSAIASVLQKLRRSPASTPVLWRAFRRDPPRRPLLVPGFGGSPKNPAGEAVAKTPEVGAVCINVQVRR
jgi:hypothetical protein